MCTRLKAPGSTVDIELLGNPTAEATIENGLPYTEEALAAGR